MNRIHELGGAIFEAQLRLGLENPNYHQPGLAPDEFKSYSFLVDVSPPSELHQLFGWRNGASRPGIPMEKLRIMPWFYLLSAHYASLENKYASAHLPHWLHSWYPLLTNGAAVRIFVDVATKSNGRFCLFLYDP